MYGKISETSNLCEGLGQLGATPSQGGGVGQLDKVAVGGSAS